MFDVIAQTVRGCSQIGRGPWQGLGDVLLVGEGNMSFSLSLLRMSGVGITDMTTTTFENERQVSPEAKENARALARGRIHVLHGVDATKLDKVVGADKFDTIIFQFPHAGSRDAKYGRNPNHILIRNFLRSAKEHLAPAGKVMISVVSSPHYDGAFQFDEAAKFADFHVPESYPFDPSQFFGYAHTNTNDNGSAFNAHTRFATWMFRPKS